MNDVPRCVYCRDPWSLCQCPYPAQTYEELIDKLERKIAELNVARPEAGAMTWSQLAALNGLLDEIEEYLGQREDIRDGSDGQQLPNEEMSLLSDLRWWRSVLPKPEPQHGIANETKSQEEK